MGSIDENALNALSLVVELTKHIKTKSEKDAGGEPETGAEFANFFPSFLWVIRDFTLQLVDENGNSFAPKTYLERSLTPMQGFSEGVEVKNRIRRMLLAFFPNRDCVTLKRPVEDESLLQTLDDAEWSDFRPEFIEQVKAVAFQCLVRVFQGLVRVLQGLLLQETWQPRIPAKRSAKPSAKPSAKRALSGPMTVGRPGNRASLQSAHTQDAE